MELADILAQTLKLAAVLMIVVLLPSYIAFKLAAKKKKLKIKEPVRKVYFVNAELEKEKAKIRMMKRFKVVNTFAAQTIDERTGE